jgi:O-antigen/teichoic acid export membrane protein
MNQTFVNLKGFGLVTLSAGLASGFAFLVSPLLTRLYSPADFGVFAAFAALLTAGLSVVNLRYEVAVPLPEDDADAKKLVQSSILIALGVSVLMTVLIWVLSPVFFEADMLIQIKRQIGWLTLGFATGGIVQVLTQFAVRRGEFFLLAKTRLIQGVAGPSTQVLAGFSNLGTAGLLIGQVVFQAGGVLGLWRCYRKVLPASSSTNSTLTVLRRYENFPRISLLPAFINAFGLQLPVLVVGKFHGAEAAGLIGLVFRIVGGPMAIIASSSTQVILSEGGRLRRGGSSIQPLFAKIFRQQLVFSVPLLLVTPAFPWLFRYIFGQAWEEAGKYSLLLGPAIVIQSACSPFGAILDVLERQDLHFAREIIRVVLLCLSVWVASRFGGTLWALVATLSMALVLTGIITCLFAWLSGKMESEPRR